jgi:hypothetical protein
MDRDRRLTGSLRGQIDRPEAPPGFELSNAWKASRNGRRRTHKLLTRYYSWSHALPEHALTRLNHAAKVPHTATPGCCKCTFWNGEVLEQPGFKRTGKTNKLKTLSIYTSQRRCGTRSNTTKGRLIHIDISALFLLSVSNSVHAWHIAWLDM